MIAKKIFLIIALILISNKAYSDNIFIETSINDKILTNIDINQEISYLKILNPKLNQLDKKKIFNIAKNSLINETIREEEIIKFFKLDEELTLIDNIFNDFINNLGFSNKNEFEKILLNNNTYSIPQIKEKMKIEFFWNRLILDKYNNQVKINKKKLIQKIKNSNEVKKEYLLSEIFFNKSKNMNLNEQVKQIKQSISEVGFNNTASIFSRSESSNVGGKIGWIDETNLSQKIIDELKKIKKNEYTNVIQFGNNFLILKIDDIKINKVKTNEELKLKKMIEYEKNKQLNQFSNMHFNKIKVNYNINEK